MARGERRRRRAAIAREVDAELAFHVEMRARRLEAEGMAPAAALAEARRRFGSASVRATCIAIRLRGQRRARVRERVDRVLLAARLAARAIRARPTVTAWNAVALGGGLAGVIALYGVAHAVLIAPLPYPEPDRLVALWQTHRTWGRDRLSLSPPNYEDLRLPDVFEATGALLSSGYVLENGGDPTWVSATMATGSVFRTLGVEAALGRTLQPADDGPDGARVVVLSDRLWRERFGGSADVLGRRVRLQERPYAVVGVMPPAFTTDLGFSVPARADLWIPFDLATDRWENRTLHWLRVVGRLREGVDVEAAHRRVQETAHALSLRHPETNGPVGARAASLEDQVTEGLHRPLLTLFAGMALVLFVAASNTATLLLGQTFARSRELGVRRALGAQKWEVAAQLLLEALGVTALALLLAVAGAHGVLEAVREMAPPGMPRIDAAAVHGGVLALGAAAALLAALVAAAVPAWRAARTPVGPRLGARVLCGGKAPGSLHALAAVQVALATVTLVGGALVTRSFVGLRGIDPGFDYAHVVSARLRVDGAGYETGEARMAFYDELMRRIRRVPGVRAVGTTTRLPLEPAYGTTFLDLERAPLPLELRPEVGIRSIGYDYLETMGIGLVTGRRFRPGDGAGGPLVALVNRALAERYFPDVNAVGERLHVGGPSGAWREIVGVIEDVSHDDLDAPAIPEVYLPLRQSPSVGVILVVRVDDGAGDVVPRVERTLRDLDRRFALARVKTLAALRAESLAPHRFLMVLLWLCSGLAVVTAATGQHAVLAHLARRRNAELGLRLALGASRPQLARLLLGTAVAIAGPGCAAGVVLAGVAATGSSSLLAGVGALDPVAWGGALAIVAGVVLVSALVPAWAAARVDPMRTLGAG